MEGTEQAVDRNRGWFHTPDRAGDRELSEQMTGLEQLVAEAPGKTVLDCGCAEGLISFELAKVGARCHGLDSVERHIDMANQLTGDLACTFERANLNHYELPRGATYDIVLMLAVLHKLRYPAAVCEMLAGACRDLCVIRMPPYGLRIVDARSGNRPHDIGEAMTRSGFHLEAELTGPRDEWVGYFRRGTKSSVSETKAPVPETDLPQAETISSVSEPTTPVVESIDVTPMSIAQMTPEPIAPAQAAVEPDPKPAAGETDELTVGAEDAPAKIETGAELFPTAQRRRRARPAKAETDSNG